ncbi:MAG: efflux RND transporter permease subunit [Planctomycetes bacterium]|nr:efflux RND transporter permease subunit [Planctomycetota bacterium]
MAETQSSPRGVVAALVRPFLAGPFAPLFLVAALLAGAGAVWVTPREEEPQIVVPLADVVVQFPGASAEEVEKLVATPLERLLWQIDGVEYVYSTARRDVAVVTVRFHVGEDRERSWVKIYNKIESNLDLVPPGVRGWLVKPVEIDDVPIVTLTLHSAVLDDHALRRVGEEVLARLEAVEDLSRTEVVGGRRRQVIAYLDPERLAGAGLDVCAVFRAVAGADAEVTAGSFPAANRLYPVTAGPFLGSADEVRRVVVGVHDGRPVPLEDVAEVRDGPEEPVAHVRYSCGAAAGGGDGAERAAVTLALAKKKGTNAVRVADEVLARMAELRRDVLPEAVEVAVTRNYGETADRKVDELLEALAVAMISVVILLTLVLGWREAVVVAISVPVAFALALFVNYLAGYTINRVTLFALILSLGIVVDDPITNIDNIQRHFRARPGDPIGATLRAVREVFPPVLMSTLAIVVCFLPMFFITGMMGPYMAPMAANVPFTITFSMVAALTIVPWLAVSLLKGRRRGAPAAEVPAAEMLRAHGFVARRYRALVGPLLRRRALRAGLLAGIVVLIGVAGLLALTGLVPLKMLPYADRDEFELVLDMPEGTPLEATDGAVRDLEAVLATVPEVTDFQSYVGVPSPMDFNGMVRHYYLRREPHHADVRVNLVQPEARRAQSHAIALRVRDRLSAAAARHGGNLKVVEIPPGPPVISTLTVEIYGEPDRRYEELETTAAEVRTRMARVAGLVDVDDTTEARRERWEFVLDREKAALHGIANEAVVEALGLAVGGAEAATVHAAGERQPLRVVLRLTLERRAGVEALGRLAVVGEQGEPVPLAEIGRFVSRPVESPIYHKNLQRVVYVFGETAGVTPAEAVLGLQASFAATPPPAGTRLEWAGEGEWKITLDVFRDLGLAFAVALAAIYVLLVIETRSLLLPMVIMASIPLTAIGIMPGFYLLNLVSAGEVGGYADPVFFTATGMIGMIALGGIVVRNAVVLVSFIRDARAEGVALEEAILECGAVRFRPIVLTAATTALGAWPITLDPIFSGLAWSLIFGLVASTLFTLLVVPTIYYMAERRGKNAPGAFFSDRPA